MKQSLKLAEIQKIMVDNITLYHGKNNDTNPDHLISQIVCEKPPISFDKRLKIYQEAYHIRLKESLMEDFTRVEEKVGHEEFKKIIHEFISSHPSVYITLAEYSQNFPFFLKNISGELYELAQIDWIEIMAYYTQEISKEKLLTPTEVQSGQRFQFVLNPTLFTFTGETEITMAFRREEEVFLKTIQKSEWRLLDLVRNNKDPLDFACALENEHLDLELISNLISNWIKEEIIFCERVIYVKENA